MNGIITLLESRGLSQVRTRLGCSIFRKARDIIVRSAPDMTSRLPSHSWLI